MVLQPIYIIGIEAYENGWVSDPRYLIFLIALLQRQGRNNHDFNLVRQEYRVPDMVRTNPYLVKQLSTVQTHITKFTSKDQFSYNLWHGLTS